MNELILISLSIVLQIFLYFFTHNMGWRSDGNKLINSILSENKALIDAKIKEIFKTNN